MVDQKKETQNPKDGLALIIGGLFILALVFAAYNYFSKGSKVNNELNDDNTPMFEKLSNENKNDKAGDLNGKGAKTEASVKDTISNNNSTTTTSETTWVANDYKSGDIKAGSYTVKSGDTLWEIAEAAYGNGADWHKILDANKSSVGFLPNGSQALIVTGQVLVLP